MPHAPSVFDDLYFELFGHCCTKEGQAFERIVAAVAQITFPNAEVAHDKRLRGQISESLYQIDVLQTESGQQSFGEAKDYTVQNKKVGRGDLQKPAGALGDVAVEKGAMYSATDYTKPAKQYAEGAKQIINKEISLYHLRPSIEKDLEGRIRTVVINIHMEWPDHANSIFDAIWTPVAKTLLMGMLGIDSPPVSLPVDVLYDGQGQRLTVNDRSSPPLLCVGFDTPG
jgi:Restriction endonuclease